MNKATLVTRNLWRKLHYTSASTTITLKILKTKTKKANCWGKIGDKNCILSLFEVMCIKLSWELDGWEALAELFRSKKSLFAKNFSQVLMAHAVSTFADNFDLVAEKFDGCGISVFIGHPVSGKSTAMKDALSVFGDTALINSKFDVLCFSTIKHFTW